MGAKAIKLRFMVLAPMSFLYLSGRASKIIIGRLEALGFPFSEYACVTYCIIHHSQDDFSLTV